MIYKPFHGIEISTLGLGGLRFPIEAGAKERIDRAAAAKVVDAALAGGINFIDTAYTYQNGDSERFLGEALAKYPRESYYLSTKFYAAAKKPIQEVFFEQLKRCKTDYFDFYLFHSLDENYIDEYMDPKKDELGFMLEQKKAGRIRFLGFSSHATPDVLERFLNWYDGFDMAIIQLNYLDWTLLDGKRQYELLTAHNIPIWVMEPLKGGRLATLNDKAAGVLQAALPGRSLPEWGFRYLMDLPNVQTVMSGMSDVAQIEENVRIFSRHEGLTKSQGEALQTAAAAFLEEMGVPCSGCRYCCATCPMELDIPLLLKGYNEMRVSESTWRLASLEKTGGPEDCIGCGTCLAHCPQKIQIPESLKHFAQMRAKG